MLPYFPTPLPDELLYSAIARYKARIKGQSHKAISEEIFDSKTACASCMLPGRIQDILNKLPVSSSLTSSYIIQNHTLLPLFMPFLPKENITNIIHGMLDSMRGTNVYMTAGITASTIGFPRFLNYCPECVMQDKDLYGEPYWHRAHQVPGAFVCHIHRVDIRSSTVAVSCPQNKHAFIALTEKLIGGITGTVRNDFKSGIYNNYINIAKDIAYLLENPFDPIGLEVLLSKYIHYLDGIGLISMKGRIRQRDLIRAFSDYYPKIFLESLGCVVLPDKSDNWLSKMMRKPRVSVHPIRHLLVMRFLGLSPNDFFSTLSERVSPFGVGPWPCLNKVSSHYQQPIVHVCQITLDSKKYIPVGTFACLECGFVYSRRGPDHIIEDRLRIGTIKSFGHVWEEIYLENVRSGLNSFRSIARKLSVSVNTVIRRYNKGKVENWGKAFPSFYIKEERKKRRGRWLAIIKAHPSETRSRLRKCAKADYAWLYRHDKRWLLKNPQKMSAPIKRGGRFVDWDARDKKLKEMIRPAVEKIKSSSTKTARVTISSIGISIGHLDLLQKHIYRLPETKACMDEYIESIDDYQVRRIKIAVEYLNKKGVGLSVWRIVRKAGFRPGYSDSVSEALQKAVANGSNVIQFGMDKIS